MTSPPPRANCFDASALVKVFTFEQGSDVVRDYFGSRSPTKYTTPFCFYEALNVLKVKWKYRKEISRQEYTEASFRLTAWYQASTRYAKDIDFGDAIVFHRVQAISEKYALDLSDAFQILSVKEGYFSHLINDSKTILVTADEALAKAARGEGLKAWYFMSESEP